jgi:hypothetical protein
MKNKTSKGFKKHIRRKKSFIRKETFNLEKQKNFIQSIFKLLKGERK